MKTFSQFMTLCEATYDKEVMSGSQIRTMGTGGRVSPERKKSTPEIRRTKRVGGGQVKPVSYKPRKDIGTQKTAAERQAQPEKERGSKEVTQSYAEKVKAERRAAAKARASAKASGTAAPKPKAKELEKKATQLLSKKATDKPKASTPAKDERFSSSRKPSEHQIKGKYSRGEKKQLVRAGKQKLRDLVLKTAGKKKESELKHKYTGPDKD
jgi:hypothetical protein